MGAKASSSAASVGDEGKSTAVNVTVQDVFEDAKVTKFMASVEKAFSIKSSDDAGPFLRMPADAIKAACKEAGLKPGHRARVMRSYRAFRLKTGVEVSEERAQENEQVWINSFVPFATFLSAIDSKSTPAVAGFLKSAAEAAVPLRKLFESFDKNKDGVLDKGEFASGFSKLLSQSNVWLVPYLEYMAANPLPGMTSELDLLKTVTADIKANMAGYHAQIIADAADEKAIENVFKTADSNKDGRIDQREFMHNVMVCLFASIDKAVLKQAADKAKKEAKSSRPVKPAKVSPPIDELDFRPGQVKTIRGRRIRPVKMGKRVAYRRGRPLHDDMGLSNGVLDPPDLLPFVNPVKNGVKSEWATPPHPAKPKAAKATTVTVDAKQLDAKTLKKFPRKILASAREYWLQQAKEEHASIASFARHTLELMKFGAPAGLLRAALSAGQDEIRHAQLAFGLASRFDPDGKVFEPSKMDLDRAAPLANSVQSMLAQLVDDGCIGETTAVAYGARALRSATDPQARNALEAIVKDEARHAKLAWDTAAWAVRNHGAKALSLAAPIFARLVPAKPSAGKTKSVSPESKIDVAASALEALGVVSDDEYTRIANGPAASMLHELWSDLNALGASAGNGAKKIQWDPEKRINACVEAILKGA